MCLILLGNLHENQARPTFQLACRWRCDNPQELGMSRGHQALGATSTRRRKGDISCFSPPAKGGARQQVLLIDIHSGGSGDKQVAGARRVSSLGIERIRAGVRLRPLVLTSTDSRRHRLGAGPPLDAMNASRTSGASLMLHAYKHRARPLLHRLDP